MFYLAVMIIALALLPAALSVAAALGILAIRALMIIAVVSIVCWLVVAYPTFWILVISGAAIAVAGWYGVVLNVREVLRLLRKPLE